METAEFFHLVEKLHVKTILRLSDATEHVRLQKQYSNIDWKYNKWSVLKAVFPCAPSEILSISARVHTAFLMWKAKLNTTKLQN